MLKNKLTILIVLLALIFAGCSGGVGDRQSGLFGGSDNGGNNDVESGKLNPHVGIEMEFFQGQSVREIRYEEEDYELALEFKNHIIEDISDLRLKVWGPSSSQVTGLLGEYGVENIGRGYDSVGPDSVTFNLPNVRFINIVDTFTGQVNFDYCYSAKTTYRESICISEEGSCGEGAKFVNGPVKVSISSKVLTPNSVRIELDVENSESTGKVVQTCFESNTPSILEDVTVRIGDEEGNCMSVPDEYRLRDNNLKLRCTFDRDLASEDQFTGQIVAELEYKYQQRVTETFNVQDYDSFS